MAKQIKNITFTRYGGLSPLKQDHYLPHGHPDKGMHNPPCKRGIYAMPTGYFEEFLLGATDSPRHISGKCQWLKDEEGNLVEDCRTYDDTVKFNYGVVCPPKLKNLLKKLNIKEKQLRNEKLIPPIICPPDPNERDGEWSDCDTCPSKDECYKQRESPSYLVVLKPPKVFEHYGEIWHHLDAKHEQILGVCGKWVKTTYEDYIDCFNRDLHETARDAYKTGWNTKEFHNHKIINPYKRSFGCNYNRDHLEVFIEKIKK